MVDGGTNSVAIAAIKLANQLQEGNIIDNSNKYTDANLQMYKDKGGKAVENQNMKHRDKASNNPTNIQ
jgi:hypothetical protein